MWWVWSRLWLIGGALGAETGSSTLRRHGELTSQARVGRGLPEMDEQRSSWRENGRKKKKKKMAVVAGRTPRGSCWKGLVEERKRAECLKTKALIGPLQRRGKRRKKKKSKRKMGKG